MRLFIVISALLTCLICAVGCNQSPDSTDSQGKSVYLNQYRGKWVLVNFWSSHCPPCIKEIPELDKFYNQHKDKVAIFGVNFDGLPAEALEKMRTKYNMHYPQLVSFPQEKYGVGDIGVLPMTLVINPKGEVVKQILGPQTHAKLAQIIGMEKDTHHG